MFSRRILRIKAMQYLFAFFVQQKANQAMGSDNLAHLLNGQNPDAQDLQNLLGGLEKEGQKIKITLLQCLHLLLTWGYIDHQKASALVQRPCTTLAQNTLLQLLKNHFIFSSAHPVYWPEELAERWYYHCLKTHPCFSPYIAKPNHTYEQDADFITTVIKKIIFKHKSIQKQASLQDICWAENKLVVERVLLDFVEKCLKNTGNNLKDYSLVVFAEEKDFYYKLVSNTVEKGVIYETYIDKKLKNWDLARVTSLDLLLIKMALTEVLELVDIPKSVVINEYLDIAKKYSTPKSHLFINGMLEGLIADLTGQHSKIPS